MSSTQSKLSARDQRILSGIALIINVLEQLNSSKQSIENLGMSYVDIDKDEKLRRDIQQMKSILLTSGDPVANDLLIRKINKLEYEISARFPYLPLIRKCTIEVYDAFRLAVGKHHQKYEQLVQNAMVKSLQGVSVIDETKVGFLPDKKNRKKKVAED